MHQKIYKALDFLADHPAIGVVSGLKVYMISMVDFTTLEVAGKLFQSAGYIFGGALACLTFSAYVAKNIVLPTIAYIKKIIRK